MTIATAIARADYAGNGISVMFPVPFYFLEAPHIEVVRRGVDGVETALSKDVHFTVAGAGVKAGGAITMLTAPASGEQLTIRRKVPITQTLDYVANDPFPAESHELGLDKSAMIDQQLAEEISRTLRAPVTDPIVTTLPRAADRASKFMAFDAVGNPIAASGTGADAGLRDDLGGDSGSAILGFLQSGTGAFKRTVQSKLRDSVHVDDFANVALFASLADRLQHALDRGAGQTVEFGKGVTYELTDELLVSAGTNVELNQAEVEFNVTGAKYGFKMADFSAIRNGTVRHVNTANEGGVNGSHRSCVTVGSFNTNPGVGAQNVTIERLALSSVRPNGNVVSVYSDSKHVTIRHCTFDGEGAAKNGVCCHWSLDDSVGAAEGTRHPGFVTVEHCTFAGLSVSVYQSASYSVTVERCEFNDCAYGVELYRGDYSNDHAPADIKPLVGKGYRIIGNVARGCAYPIRLDGVQGPDSGANIIGAVIKGNTLHGPGTSTAEVGIWMRGFDGVEVSGNTITGFGGYGVDFFGMGGNALFEDNEISENALAGVWSRDTDVITKIDFERNRIYKNGADQPGSIIPGIRMAALCEHWTFDRNRFGAASGEVQNRSIYIVAGAKSPVLTNNHTYGLVGGGYAYTVSGASSLAVSAAMRMHFVGNTAAAGLNLYDGPPPTEIFGPKGNLRVYHNAAPDAGAWVAGDEQVDDSAAAAGVRRRVCTTAGTPGTWKTAETLAA